MKDTKLSKKAAKRLAVIAKTPKPTDISRASSSRSQFSIKDKRKVAKYAVKHNLTAREVSLGTRNIVSIAQATAWKRDYVEGRFKIGHAVSVSRS